MDQDSALRAKRIRDRYIPVPGKNEGYVKVLLLGTTGAGKTTLLRQLIGSHPRRDRFPSTAPGRTTVFDMEIIPGDINEYRAVATFYPQQRIKEYISDNILAASKAYINGAHEQEINRRFFESSDQRFRLNYILGSLKTTGQDVELEDVDDDIDDDDIEELAVDELAAVRHQQEMLQFFIRTFKNLAQDVWDEISDVLGGDLEEYKKEEQVIFEEWFAEYYLKDARFNHLVDEILKQVREKFKQIQVGDLLLAMDGWPQAWYLASGDRDKMLTILRRLTGNHQKHFGTLLTPLVQGLRVTGPFVPAWGAGEIPRLVMMDGEGLFHEANANAQFPPGIFNRIDESDTVLLVDDATHPMMREPMELLRHIVVNGNEAKLYVCFTHFDCIRGDNLLGAEAKKNHVRTRLDSALQSLGEVLGGSGIRNLQRYINERVFFMGYLQRVLKPSRQAATCSELARLVEQLQGSLVTDITTAEVKKLDLGSLLTQIDETNVQGIFRQAPAAFYEKWRAILGFYDNEKYPKEHWMKIKTLTRRLSFGGDGYVDLYPVTDLIASLLEAVYRYVEDLVNCSGLTNVTEEKRDIIKSNLRNEISKRIRPAVIKKLNREKIADWNTAYEYKGRGSSTKRAKDVLKIFQSVFPELMDGNVPLAAVISSGIIQAFAVVAGKMERGDGFLISQNN